MRKYLPTLSVLIDTLSIVTLKSIKLKHKKEYEQEAQEIMHDINEIMKDVKITDWGKFIRAVQVDMLANETIWQNETKARKGSDDQDHLLKFTHTINGLRRRAGNMIANLTGQRLDLNLDTLNEEVCKKYGYDLQQIP